MTSTSLTYGYGVLFASLAAVTWGISPILYKKALREMGPWKVNSLRGVGILVVLAPLLYFMDRRLAADLLSIDVKICLMIALIALMNNIVGDVFYLAAIRDIGVSLAVPIGSSYPLAVTLAAWLWFGEKLTFFVLGGTLSIVAGLTLLNVRSADASATDARAADGNKRRYFRGVIASVLAALCWAVGLTMNKYLVIKGVSPMEITFWRSLSFSVMAIAALPLAALTGKKEAGRASTGGVLAAVISGVIALLIGTWFFTTSLIAIPVSVATPLGASSPLAASVFACAFMGESLRPIQWLGVALVMTGAMAVGM